MEVTMPGEKFVGHGYREATVLPQVGDFYGFNDDNGHAVYFEVVALTLADRDDPNGAADVHVRRVGGHQEHSEAIRSRCR